MTAWQKLPSELQLRDADLVSLSMQDVEALFNLATKLGVVDQFADLFWPAMERVRCQPDRASLQRCVDFLEEHKRRIGRAYNVAKLQYTNGWLAYYQAIRYNEIEYNIRWLVEQYGCTRKSQAYLLEAK